MTRLLLLMVVVCAGCDREPNEYKYEYEDARMMFRVHGDRYDAVAFLENDWSAICTFAEPQRLKAGDFIYLQPVRSGARLWVNGKTVTNCDTHGTISKPVRGTVPEIPDTLWSAKTGTRVLGTTKMRCVITGAGIIHEGALLMKEQEFYIECEPVTEEP